MISEDTFSIWISKRAGFAVWLIECALLMDNLSFKLVMISNSPAQVQQGLVQSLLFQLETWVMEEM